MMDDRRLQEIQSKLHPETWDKIQNFLTCFPTAKSKDYHPERKLELIQKLLEDVSLPVLFVGMQYSYSDECPKGKKSLYSNLSKEAISKIFKSSLGPSLALANAEFIQAGLAHAHPDLRKAALQLVHDLLGLSSQSDSSGPSLPLLSDSHAEVISSLFLQEGVVSLLIGTLPIEQVSTSELAVEVLLTAARINPQVIAQALVAGAGQDNIQNDATLQLRFADAAAKLAGLSDTAFAAALEAGALTLVWGPLLETDDVLARLNALDLIPLVAASTSGLKHLFQQGLVRSLLDLALGDKDSGAEPDPILGANALTILSNLYARACLVVTAGEGSFWDEVGDADLVAAFLRAALAHLDGCNEGGRLSAIDAVSSLAMASPQALKLILEDSTLLRAWIHFYGMKLEMKAACLHSIARVILPLDDDRAKKNMGTDSISTGSVDQTVDEEDNDEEYGVLKQRLFAQLGTMNDAGSTLDLLLGCIRQPVDELRFASYDVLRSVAGQKPTWGILLVFGDPGLVAILKNRETETSKQGKEWKFSVIEAGMKNSNKNLLAPEIIDSFERILREGPFYAESRVGEMQTIT